MNIDKYLKWLKEDKQEKRNFFVLIGPPAVGKTSWIQTNIKRDHVVVSKDNIIETVIFPKYNLANKDIFKTPVAGLEVGEEHPERKKLGKVISYKRFSRSKNKEVEEKSFENSYLAGEELNKIYEQEIKKAIASPGKDIIIDAIHMSKSTRASTIDFVRDDEKFNIIGVEFPFKGYEQQIYKSAEARAKDYLDKYGKEFDRGVEWSDYEEIYSKYEEPSESEGFDKIISAETRFKETDKELGIELGETLSEKLVRNTKNFLKEDLSKYWKNRADLRSKNARRDPGNEKDIEWAKSQQQKSSSINSKVYKIFEKDVTLSEEIIEEVEKFLETVKTKVEERKRKKAAASFFHPKNKPKKKLGNPYKDAKTTSKYPYSKDRTGGVAKVFRRRSKNAGGPTIAPGESFGPLEENANPLDSLSDVQKENFFKLIGDVEEYDILKLKQGKKMRNLLTRFNVGIMDIVEFVEKCPIFKKASIKEVLTAGTKGFIYLLDNGHVLKLFQEDYSGDKDLVWYQTTKTKIFTSRGNVTDLPIYDEGKVELSSGEFIKFVEMARVTPLSDFVEFTRRSVDDAEGDYELCKAIMGNVESIYGSKFTSLSDTKLVNVFKNYVQKHDMNPSSLTKQEFISLARTIFLFTKSGNLLHDSHVGNIGILPQSNPSNPIFVIFDN